MPAPHNMTARIATLAFQGMEPREVEVQCQLAPGLPAFHLVGLADKAVTEARERVRAALTAIGLALPPRRITVNLAPADLPKAGAHYDLPIALALLAATGAIPADETLGACAMGELRLDGRIAAVAGALPGALAAAQADRAFICPEANGAEAALVGAAQIIAAPDLVALIGHMNNRAQLPVPRPAAPGPEDAPPDLADVRGQERARRALEVAAAGGHALLMIGPPGAGKSMLASRLPSILPPMDPAEALEVSMIRSVAGLIEQGRISQTRPFRAPHHSASMAAMVGGGRRAAPGEVSLAHRGVLFLDELPEFSRPVLESLRQPLEAGETTISRANAHCRYPARTQLVAAMNPCKCGHLGDPAQSCARAPNCGLEYQARISGPLLDRIDMRVETPALSPAELSRAPRGEASAAVAARVARARARQAARFEKLGAAARINAEAEGDLLDAIAPLEADARELLERAALKLRLSARGWGRALRLARSIADLAGEERIARAHMAEAVGYRQSALIR